MSINRKTRALPVTVRTIEGRIIKGKAFFKKKRVEIKPEGKGKEKIPYEKIQNIRMDTNEGFNSIGRQRHLDRENKVRDEIHLFQKGRTEGRGTIPIRGCEINIHRGGASTMTEKKFDPIEWERRRKEDARKKEEELQAKWAAEKENAEKIALVFPKGVYHDHKKEITKFRKDLGVNNWTGSGWIGEDVTIETAFYKTAVALGTETEDESDVLWISGNAEKVADFIGKVKEWCEVITEGQTKITQDDMK